MASTSRTLVFVPTYNEAANVRPLFDEIEGLGLRLDYLFIDDASPDGTGSLLDRLAAACARVRVIHRPAKLGIGSAHRAGIEQAYDSGYRALVTLDCDFTHSPAYIPRLVELAETCDVAVGSRFHSRDSLPGWAPHRRFLTRAAHIATRRVLGFPYDATGAFRVYRLDRVDRRLFSLVESPGYAFFLESLFVLWRNGVAMGELPVVLPARAQGQSKMTVGDGLHSLRTLSGLAWRRVRRPSSLLLQAETADAARAATGES